MPDQTPVTDEDCRKAHEWAVTHRAPTVPDEARAAARAIRAHVPAPPATLADELRKLATVLPVERQWFDEIDLLADRVEAVEQERDNAQQDAVDAWEHAAQTDRDHVRAMGLWEQDYARVATERYEARAEVERLKEQDEARSDSDQWKAQYREEQKVNVKVIAELDKLKFDTLEGKTAIGWMEDAKSARVEVERLTGGRPTRVIDRPEDLDALPVGSVVLDRVSHSWEKYPDDEWYSTEFDDGLSSRRFMDYNIGPATVIHEGVTA